MRFASFVEKWMSETEQDNQKNVYIILIVPYGMSRIFYRDCYRMQEKRAFQQRLTKITAWLKLP